MTTYTINSETLLQSFIGDMRELWAAHKFVKASVKTGKDRSLPQNSLTHRWYEQLSRELREDNALGWKCFCKLHYGVPILRAEDEQFRETYDAVIKPLTYERKLIAMRAWPVTSLMSKDQLSQYLELMRAGFADRVRLEFPEVK